jgi:putative selenium metabolism protein SsnA
MAYLLKSALLVTLDPAAVARADIRIKGGQVVERGARLDRREGEEVISLAGRLIMPGLVCAHTHLYSALARGMPAPMRAPGNFKEILELVWWRLDRALDEETIYWSAMAGALDAARAGTTCLFDHHASPRKVTGSLGVVGEALQRVGLRGVLCYEVTDRGGVRERDEGLDENRAFLEWTRGPNGAEAELFRGLVGAHASFTLSDESLGGLAELMQKYDAGLHIHVAEDLCDEEDARKTYGASVVERLARAGALNRQTILAHGTHLDKREIEMARAAGVWFAHNPRSNMNNRVGYAPVAAFGDRVVVGTDGIGADMFEETRAAFFKSQDEHSGLDANSWLRALTNNQRMAGEAFGLEMSTLEAGSAADLVVMNYQSPTEVTADNLAWHFLFGMNSAAIESVMVAGRFVIRNNRSQLDEDALYGEARRASEKLWAKLRKDEG